MNDASNHNGIFWLIDGILHCYIFSTENEIGVAKSGKTYNHKKLWEANNGFGTRKPFDYYPRGRVEYSKAGIPIIYMSPHIDAAYIDELKVAFGIATEPNLKYDYSNHYQCYLDWAE